MTHGRAVAVLDSGNNGEPAGLAGVTRCHHNVVREIVLGEAIDVRIPPLGGDVARFNIVSLHRAKKVIDHRVIVIVIDVVCLCMPIRIDDNQRGFFMGEP